MMLSLSADPLSKTEFTRLSTVTNAIYHSAQITLNVEIIDLQIYAGACHIIGRPVSEPDYDRSRRIVQQWAKPGGPTPAAQATWHAACVLRDGIVNLDDWDVNDAFHYPWCLYLATVTCWAFHSANKAEEESSGLSNGNDGRYIPSAIRGDGDLGNKHILHANAEMNALVSNMVNLIPEDLWRVLGKYPTSGLTTVVVNHLSNIRWAIVLEAVKVLRNLFPKPSTGRPH